MSIPLRVGTWEEGDPHGEGHGSRARLFRHVHRQPQDYADKQPHYCRSAQLPAAIHDCVGAANGGKCIERCGHELTPETWTAQGTRQLTDSAGGAETSIPGSVSTLLASQHQEGHRKDVKDGAEG